LNSPVSGVDACFLDQLEGWAEVVLVERPLVDIEIIDQRHELLLVEAVVTEQLPDMRPVFLFDMGVVVLFVSP